MKILLVVADSMRYGHFWPDLPGATIYSNAYSCAPWTAGSMATLLTGLYPSTALQQGLAKVNSEQPITLADWLGGDIGYHCSATWLLNVGHFCRNFDVWRQEPGLISDDALVRRTSICLDHLGENAFHITWLHGVHFPYQPKPETRDLFGLDSKTWRVRDFIRRGELPIPKATLANCFDVKIVAKTSQESPEYPDAEVTTEEIEFLQRAYAACCWDMNKHLEELYRAAGENG